MNPKSTDCEAGTLTTTLLRWFHDSDRFHNCRNKPFSGKPIQQYNAAPFVFIFVILSSLAALLTLI